MGKKRKQILSGDRDPRATEKRNAEVEKGLSAIFREDDGAVPDLSQFDRRRSTALYWIAGGAFVFVMTLIVAVWVGFTIFKPFRGFSGTGFRLTMDGPTRVTLGQETTYFINWQNTSGEPIANADVRVSFPPDFQTTQANPEPSDQGTVWHIGAIAFNGHGTITVKGIFTGALGTKTAIQAVGNYRPASFNSDFEALATRQLEYADSVLSGTIDAPPKILPGDDIRIAYTVQNKGDTPLTGLEARITLPQGFVRDTSSTDTVLDGAVARISIGDLAAGASTTVAVHGSFASGASGDVPVHAELGHVDADGSYLAAQKSDATLSVLSGDLTLHLVANGSDADQVVGMRDPLRFALAYENTSPEDIQGITLHAIFEPISSASGTSVTPPSNAPPLLVDWSQLGDSSSGTVVGNTISWTSDQLDVLKRLTPQTDGVIEFSVPVAVHTTGTDAVPFHVVVEGTMEKVGTTPITRVVRTKPIAFTLHTDADLTTEARYFSEEGAPYGTGPLPPVVGQTTNYRIFWTIDKTFHELGGVKVNATLPKSVAWPNNATVSAGNISYDDMTRTVTWTLNRLPTDVNEATAQFDVQLTPSAADANRFADLLGESRFEITDTTIGQTIVKTKPGVDTNLKNDDGAKNKGVVREQ